MAIERPADGSFCSENKAFAGRVFSSAFSEITGRFGGRGAVVAVTTAGGGATTEAGLIVLGVAGAVTTGALALGDGIAAGAGGALTRGAVG
jgi:hypothetical protein